MAGGHPVRPAVADVGTQQLLQQPAADTRHRGAEGQLHPLQVTGAPRERAASAGGGELGRELRLELTEEPPFAGGPGRALGVRARGPGFEIGSLTSTISPTICRTAGTANSPGTYYRSGPGLMCADTV